MEMQASCYPFWTQTLQTSTVPEDERRSFTLDLGRLKERRMITLTVFIDRAHLLGWSWVIPSRRLRVATKRSVLGKSLSPQSCSGDLTLHATAKTVVADVLDPE